MTVALRSQKKIPKYALFITSKRCKAIENILQSMGIPSSFFFNASLIIFFYVLKYQSQILLYRFNNKCGADANLRK
jgi:hypothetical protein